MATVTYKVVYERDAESGWWLARVPAVRGCHTQGRTVEEARRRIREALGLFVENADQAALKDSIKMPHETLQALMTYRAARKRVETEEQKATRTAQMVVRRLRELPLKMSMRDAASVMGVSHQRVHQIISGGKARAAVEDRKHRS